MHSVVDWFAFAVWTDGELVRSLSISGGEGRIIEDIGQRLSFEPPYWEGTHPVDDDYRFAFPLSTSARRLSSSVGATGSRGSWTLAPSSRTTCP